ncbi:MAG TPA: S8 family serine peptidase [Actinocrinis sp.]|nr:S8 family serine peptidase [Actinocrinis sp.]
MASAFGLAALTALPAQASGNPVFDQEWALSTFKVQDIRTNFHAYGAGVVIAVVDTGVDPSQPDLQGQLVAGANVTDPNNPTSNTGDTSSEYHGTHVAAIIAAHGHGDPNNLQGLVGLASRAKVMPVKVGGDTQTAVAETAGIRYAADHGAQVINVSEGGDGPCSSAEAAAIDYALSKNIVVVAATGNNGNAANTSICPANHPGVIDVAAIAQNGTMDKYSHFGSDVTVAAPGVNIETPAPNGQYTKASGSSDAAPFVSAEAALIVGLHPNWTVGQVVRAIIGNTATGTGQRVDDHVGYGVIDPLKALGASAPTDTTNPLGGPAAAATSPAPGGANTGGAQASSSAAAPTSSSKSSNIGLYAGLGVGVLVLIGVIVFLITRGKNNNGSGGGGGGGGGNGYYPTSPGPGGQYATPQPPHQQQPTSSQQSYPYQQNPSSPYAQPQQQQYPPQSPYGQQQPPQEQTPWPQN